MTEHTQGHILLDSSYVRFLNGKIRVERIMVGVRGWRQGETGSCCSMGIKLQLFKTTKFHESYSAELRWVNLEPVILSDVSQKEKNKYCIITHRYIWNLEKWH